MELKQQCIPLYGTQTGSGVHPASYPVGTGPYSMGIKRPKREANHLLSFIYEVKKAWSYTSNPISFHEVCGLIRNL
jgi:hypothetical protein